jgi:hypothetical protein
MRFADAAHVDLKSFYARRPRLGRFYRFVGYLIIVLTVGWATSPEQQAVLLICALIAWVQAWYRAVGALWRSSLVAAALLAAALLSLPTFKAAIDHCCGAGAS